MAHENEYGEGADGVKVGIQNIEFKVTTVWIVVQIICTTWAKDQVQTHCYNYGDLL